MPQFPGSGTHISDAALRHAWFFSVSAPSRPVRTRANTCVAQPQDALRLVNNHCQHESFTNPVPVAVASIPVRVTLLTLGWDCPECARE